MGARITGKAIPQTGEHGGISANSALSRWLARARGASSLWLGTVAYVLALAGTLLLKDEPGRGWGVLMLLAGGLLAVAAWHGVPLPPALPAAQAEGRRQKAEGSSWRAAGSWASPNSGLLPSAFRHSRAWLPVVGVSGSVLLWGLACALYVANPGETFGLAGWVWLLSMALLAVSALAWDTPFPRHVRDPVSSEAGEAAPLDTQYAIRNTPHPPAWTAWEVALFAGLVSLAAVLRLWDLSRFPDYIFGDEIFEGHVAIGSYIDKPGPSVFSTLWDTVNLPALWFFALASSLKAGGVTLWALRLPAALFGAATAIPFYGLVRGAWGRSAAIFGTAVFAFSAANVHYSRVTLNNIVTPFFWTVCFFLLLRGLRHGHPAYWAGAGLAAGLSEYGHFGTRLLPFILLAFAGYLLVFHRAAGKRCLGGFGLLALGYVIGFGPLLADHALHPESYLGRGVDMLTWDHIPTSWQDLQLMWSTLWPLLAENLLGFSTHSSQDLIYFAPLLLPAEAALLVLGAALLAWHWRHPPAFLMLMSGCGVLLLGGTLVLYKGGLMPYIAHWAPAFPVFYATLALPAGIWAGQAWGRLPWRLKWAGPGAVALGLAALAWLNVTFYFHDYYANPRIPGNETYRAVAHWLEVRTAQSRYQASLGPGYKVRIVGRDDDPLNPDTRYLVSGQDWARIADPEKELRGQNTGDKPLAFIFFPGAERHLERALSLYPGGTRSEVRNRLGDLLFYTYVVVPAADDGRWTMDDCLTADDRRWTMDNGVSRVLSLPHRPSSIVHRPSSVPQQRSTHVNTQIINEKLDQAVALLEEQGLDAWVTFARETSLTMDPCIDMVVGLDLTWHSAFIVSRSGERLAIVGRFDAENVRNLGGYSQVVPYDQSIRPALVDALTRLDPQTIALNYSLSDPASDGLTHGMYLYLRDTFAGTPYAGRFVSAEKFIAALRGRKSPSEVELIRAAIVTTEQLYDRVGGTLAPGQTEREIAGKLHAWRKELGLGTAWGEPYCPIVNAGPDSPVGHAAPGDFRTARGQLLHMDFGVKQDGFCSDLQRMWYFLDDGERQAPDDVKRAWDACWGAIDAGAEKLRPGAQGWEVDAAARSFLMQAGYPEYQHALGHHLGRVAHDGSTLLGPRWDRYGDTPYGTVEVGNVFTLELGTEVPGRGYIGLEEDVLVTGSGLEWLSKPQRDIWLV